jgi:hypothetical protein
VAAGTVADNGDQYNLIGHPGGASGLSLYYVTNGDTDDATAMETVINLSGNDAPAAVHDPSAGRACLAPAPAGDASPGRMGSPAAPTAGVFLGGQWSAGSDQLASVSGSSGIPMDPLTVTASAGLNVGL